MDNLLPTSGVVIEHIFAASIGLGLKTVLDILYLHTY